MSRDGPDVAEMAALIARDYLHGPWRKVTPNSIILKKVTGGLSNWLYQMSLPPKLATKLDSNNPDTVLLRFHGQVNGESAFEHIVLESVVFTLLSERKLGPKLYGIFPGGRIEEYINARPLTVPEMGDRNIGAAIASKMADVHKLQVPISKQPTWLFDLSLKYIKTIDNILQQFQPCDIATEKILESLRHYDLREELDWLRDYLAAQNSPVVFCHNDMNEGNILLPLDPSADVRDLVLIDFEYCAYNYRAFDFANHFLEHTLDYTEDEPYFRFDLERYPSRDHQEMFVRKYLENYKGYVISSKDENHIDVEVPDHEVSALLKEVDNFRLACHFFWALWSAANAMSKIPFGYWEFFAVRFETYLRLKEDVLSFEVPGNKRKKT